MMRRSLCPQLNFPSRSQPISCLAQLNRLPSVATPRSGWMAGFLAGDWCRWIVARCTKHPAMSLNRSEDRSENPAPNQEAHEAENPPHPPAWNSLFSRRSNLETACQGPSGHPAKRYSKLGRSWAHERIVRFLCDWWLDRMICWAKQQKLLVHLQHSKQSTPSATHRNGLQCWVSWKVVRIARRRTNPEVQSLRWVALLKLSSHESVGDLSPPSTAPSTMSTAYKRVVVDTGHTRETWWNWRWRPCPNQAHSTAMASAAASTWASQWRIIMQMNRWKRPG